MSKIVNYVYGETDLSGYRHSFFYQGDLLVHRIRNIENTIISENPSSGEDMSNFKKSMMKAKTKD